MVCFLLMMLPLLLPLLLLLWQLTFFACTNIFRLGRKKAVAVAAADAREIHNRSCCCCSSCMKLKQIKPKVSTTKTRHRKMKNTCQPTEKTATIDSGPAENVTKYVKMQPSE